MIAADSIKQNISLILSEIPPTVKIVAACKTREVSEVQAALDSGIGIVGENYVGEAEKAFSSVKGNVSWHLIGHLQKNKVKRAVAVFDMIESLDSMKLAELIDKECSKINKKMDCLIEINSGREDNKSGFLAEEAQEAAIVISELNNINICGVMTMGPYSKDPESYRPFFKLTAGLFKDLSLKQLPGVNMTYLSMGMSDSYKVAIEEGANMVRIGTAIFGPRS